MYKSFFKRIIDIISSFLLLVILSPIIFTIWFILLLNYKSSPLFFQKRPGLKTRSIKIIKFKSMNDKRDENGNLLPDNIRLTSLGKYLRKFSLDELPQLINVLKGDMSLIGPRPLLFKYLSLYSNKQMRRHDVRPGITGWAQINGRNSISWEKKFDLDIYYVDNISLLLDIKIIWFTILKVIKSEGVNQSENRPMNPFNGNN